MTITTHDGLIAALATAQAVEIHRSGARTTIAGGTFSTIDLAGSPGAGVLAGTNTANGLVPTDATAGCPTVNAFSGSNTGYVLGANVGDTVATRVRFYDMLFKAGAYSFNSNVTLALQPSYSSRIPNADYTGTELWLECVTAFTGNLTATVTYTNDAGTPAKSTSLATGIALTVGRMMRIPLATGDYGLPKIESIVGSVASAGTFNLLVLRPLWSTRVGTNGCDVVGPDKTMSTIAFADMAVIATSTPDSTAIGILDATLYIGNG